MHDEDPLACRLHASGMECCASLPDMTWCALLQYDATSRGVHVIVMKGSTLVTEGTLSMSITEVCSPSYLGVKGCLSVSSFNIDPTAALYFTGCPHIHVSAFGMEMISSNFKCIGTSV